MKSLFRIFSILAPSDIRRCFWLLLAMLVGAVLEAVGIGAIMPLLSVMGQPDFLAQHGNLAESLEYIGILTHEQLIIGAAGSLLVLYVFKNVYLVYLSKWQLQIAVHFQIEYAKNLFAIYLQKPYLFHMENNTATLIHKTYDGPFNIFINLFLTSLSLLVEIFAVIAICATLFLVDVTASVVVIVFLGGSVYGIIRFFRERIRWQGEVSNSRSAEMIQWVNQGLGAIKETKVLGKEPYFYAKYEQAYQEFGKVNQQYRLTLSIPRFAIETTVVAGLLLLIMGEIYAGQAPADILPLLGLLSMAAFRLMPAANRIISFWNSIKFYMPLLDELYEEMLLVRNNRMQGGAVLVFPHVPMPMPLECEITIEHLNFHYSEVEKEVLRDVSFKIPKGSFVGIIGASGAGKTTFVDLFLGLLRPTGGGIFVDGISINDNIRAWQANLAYVPQDIYLLDSSIRENIALGLAMEEIDDERIHEVLQMAELDTFIQTLPEGMYTMVGERGVKLSGGQRQRIGIARALYHRPKVLVLDEATSALDDATEKSVTDTILKFKGKLTIIAVAHRLSTLAECDFKVCFDDGKATILNRNIERKGQNDV